MSMMSRRVKLMPYSSTSSLNLAYALLMPTAASMVERELNLARDWSGKYAQEHLKEDKCQADIVHYHTACRTTLAQYPGVW
jgi:hypothetical protein